MPPVRIGKFTCFGNLICRLRRVHFPDNRPRLNIAGFRPGDNVARRLHQEIGPFLDFPVIKPVRLVILRVADQIESVGALLFIDPRSR